MVAEAANTTVSILRGTDVDEFGDIEDTGTPITAGIPAILLETVKTTTDPATQTPRTIRSATCHLPAWTEALNSDQILDESTGQKYSVADVDSPGILNGAPADLVLTLKRITFTGT